MAQPNPEDPPPLNPGDAHAAPTWRAAYSDRTSALMATLSQLAYVAFDAAAPPAPPGAPRRKLRADGVADLAALLEPGGFELKAVFDWDDVQAFLAVDAAEFAVLAFRGTANNTDWRIDLNARPMPMPGFPGMRVHTGFWETLASQRDEIAAAVDDYVPDDLGLYITGHSLGGALAQIASAVLERDNLAACYTFGSPRAASSGFDVAVKCPHYRVINHWDLVPGLPPPWPFGYVHTGDPRLLAGRHPQTVIRRQPNGLAWLVVQVAALFDYAFTHRLFVLDDHMIWNYRVQLEVIAARRTAPLSRRP